MESIITLIQKFKTGNASESERKELLNALNIHEAELQQWLESEYYQNINANIEIISQSKSAEIFNNIQQLKNIHDTNSKQYKTKVIILASNWLKWASAACVIGIIAMGIWLFDTNKKSSVSSPIIANIQTQLKQHINNTNISMISVLEDGTKVTIEPNSGISYYSPFTIKRDISLTGKATFKVAKDAAKPFTVHANGISTTALGTEFFVDAFKDNVKVKLLEGLVVVKSIVSANAITNTYLKPGQQFSINIKSGVYAVSNFKLPNTVNNRVANVKTATTKEIEAASILSFNKTPLSVVFTKIGKQYDKLIQYNNADFGTASFTGSFLPSDSLQTILTIICNTNDLSFKEENGIIIISK